MDRVKQQAPSVVFKNDDHLNFQNQVENGQPEKSIATVTHKADIGDDSFAEHFVVMKNLTVSIIGLHFLRHNCVVIDATNGLMHLPQFTMQVTSGANEANAKPHYVFTRDNITIPPMKTKTFTPHVDHPSKRNTG